MRSGLSMRKGYYEIGWIARPVPYNFQKSTKIREKLINRVSTKTGEDQSNLLNILANLLSLIPYTSSITFNAAW